MFKITRRALAVAPVVLAAAQATAKPAPAAPAWPDATETAARIRRREITAAEAVESAIARAEALQGQLNFIVNSDFDRALAKARAGMPAGPFGGVPFLIKDLDDYVGLPTRYGSKSGRSNPPARRQSAHIDAFDRAGLVVIGKSATPEYGFLPTTEPLATGLTRNPWDIGRSSGGSSGGAAVAVAAGVVPFAHATDGGGSIRIPAACCGLFGLKPSRGRMAGTAGMTKVSDLDVQHCVTRSVRDSAALFAATEDTTPAARYAPVGFVPGPPRRRLRIGYLIENGVGHGPQPEVARATEAAARLVERLGHRLEPTHWPMEGDQFIQDFLLLWASGAKDLADNIGRATGRKPDTSLLEPFSLGMAEMAAKAAPDALPAAIQRLQANALAYDTWFPASQFDVILSPVLSSAPPPLGEVGPNVAFDTLVARLVEYVGYTPLHNIAGAPSMSVPLFWTEGGLPVGTMFSARAGNERTLFELAYQLEAAQPWAGRTPPVHA
ncbi:amidase [Phenylobacterium hankyongense]|uniref:Amidase n=1 Tax=Phenylobacterium hankyongense TaxID=1813876 RepID=A0A328B045_9CAUL|nr:amidase [Phenylobacterium hankyongense]RAK60543.1 amidase [Phenylobacterium hankyongense]